MGTADAGVQPKFDLSEYTPDEVAKTIYCRKPN
jgi:hypothetical protein